MRVPKKKPQPIPGESFDRLLAKAPAAHWRAYLLCGWWAGLRHNEVCELCCEAAVEWLWIDFERNRIVLPAVFAKSANYQSVRLHPALRQALAKLPRTEWLALPFRSRKAAARLTDAGVSNYVRRLARQASFKLSTHRLRKRVGCRVAQQLGMGNVPVLHELMRHSPVQITAD